MRCMIDRKYMKVEYSIALNPVAIFTSAVVCLMKLNHRKSCISANTGRPSGRPWANKQESLLKNKFNEKILVQLATFAQ